MNPTESINDQLNRSNGYVDQLNYRYSFFVESIIYVLSRIISASDTFKIPCSKNTIVPVRS